MARAFRAPLAILALTLTVSGCASGHSAGTTRTRHYSVGDVLRGFATQGIDLTPVNERPFRGRGLSGLSASQRKFLERVIQEESRHFIYLRAGRPPRLVLAVLRLGRIAFTSGTPVRTSVSNPGHLMTRTRRNLVVEFDSSQSAAVAAALARLR